MKALPLILPRPAQITLTESEWVRRHRDRDSTGVRLRVSASLVASLAAQSALLADYLEEENHFAAETGLAADGDIHLALTLSPRALPAKLREAGISDETRRIKNTQRPRPIARVKTARAQICRRSVKGFGTSRNPKSSAPIAVTESPNNKQ